MFLTGGVEVLELFWAYARGGFCNIFGKFFDLDIERFVDSFREGVLRLNSLYETCAISTI